MKNRLAWLDTAKGIGIILMVIGHTSVPLIISNFIWAFHMPLFFIASGWSANWDSLGFRSFVKKRVRTLLVPFAVYSMLVLGIELFQGWIEFRHWLTKGWISHALWFVPILFLASLFAKLVYSLKGKIQHRSCALLLALTGIVLSYYEIYLPWSLASLPAAIFLVILGSELNRISIVVLDSRLGSILSLFMLTFVVSRFWKLDLCFNNILPFIPVMLGAISGTLLTFNLSLRINENFKMLSMILQSIGKETYLILAFSQIIVMLINEYFTMGSVLKYVCLLVILILLKYLKDGLNRVAKLKIL